jgi:aspartate 1-decarboxylase
MTTIPMLFAKLHKATVTGADLNYEGSIEIDPVLLKESGLRPLQLVEIYNVNNGERFSTYIIKGKSGEIALNGAAARKVQKGDPLIICGYANVALADAESHTARVLLLGIDNHIERAFDAKSC